MVDRAAHLRKTKAGEFVARLQPSHSCVDVLPLDLHSLRLVACTVPFISATAYGMEITRRIFVNHCAVCLTLKKTFD